MGKDEGISAFLNGGISFEFLFWGWCGRLNDSAIQETPVQEAGRRPEDRHPAQTLVRPRSEHISLAPSLDLKYLDQLCLSSGVGGGMSACAKVDPVRQHQPIQS